MNLGAPDSDDIRIAVVGLECVFPKAPNARAFWQNIVNGVNAIGDPLPEWNSEVHLARRGDTSTDQGGYLKDLFRIEPAKFGIMPKALDGGEPDQFIALEIARRALADAGEQYLDADYDHRDTGIIVGHSPYYHRGQVNTAQHHIFVEQMREILVALKPDVTPAQIEEFEGLLRDQLPPFVTDISPGLVPNVLTGRIANRLNLRGPNYMIDAACASSLLAVQSAVDELVRGSARMMLVGGVNASLPAEVAIIFTQLGALSDTGKVRPFSATADGTLLGEGAGVVVLKRLEDALEDGDRVYSVIRGVGQSSDGRGLGLLSPSMDGEVLAMRRAYEFSHVDPTSVSLIECHGTGIPLGDRTEIGALTDVFGSRETEEGQIAIGSVKSMISHCIPAAGIAGLIKTSLALHHKLLPPTLCDEVKPELGIEETRLYVNTAPRPWIHTESQPRRAGVNAFGFGGVNAHVIVEEAPEAAPKAAQMTPWSHELVLFAAADAEDLSAQLDRMAVFAEGRSDLTMGDIAASALVAAESGGPVRLAIVAKDAADLIKKIGQAKKKLGKGKAFVTRTGVAFRPAPLAGKLGFMFAGEGSQYLGMFEDLAARFDGLRRWLDFWKDSASGTGETDRTDIFYPRASELTQEKRAKLVGEVFSMAVGSESAFLGGQAMFELLRSLGLKPDAMVGHSTGESGALVAAGVVKAESPEDMLARFREITAISREVQDGGQVPEGALLAVGLLDKDKVAAAITGTEAVIAMENCQNQTIVFVPGDGGAAVQEVLTGLGAVVEALPFNRGYHTPGFKPMQEAFEAFYSSTGVHAPEVPLYSCASAATFPAAPADIIGLAGAQWSQTVRFVDTVKAMYDDGVRAFVEVAPGGKLSSFTQQVLGAHAPGEDLLIAPSNLDGKPDLEVLLHLFGQLFTCDLYDPAPVYADRDLIVADLADPKPAKLKGVEIINTMPRIHATPELVGFLQGLGLGGAAVPALEAAPAAAPTPAAQPAPEASVGAGDAESVDLGLFKSFRRTGADVIEAEARFDINEAEFLQDHVLSGPVSEDPALFGMSCVPFMVSLEAMAEVGAVLLGRQDLGLVENMAGEGWVWADGEITDLRAVARRIGPDKVACEVYSRGQRAVSATLTFGPCAPVSPGVAPVTPGAGYSWTEPFEMYRENIFHGPQFQTIDTVTQWNTDGIEATLSACDVHGFVRPGEVPQFIVNPALFDAFTQITAFYMAQERGQHFASFPRIIRRIELYDAPVGAAEGLWVRSARTGAEMPGGDGVWSTDCFQGERLIVRIDGMENAYSDVPQSYYPYSLEPINGWLGHPVQVDETMSQIVWDMPALPADFWRRVGGVFHRVLAYSTLSAEERAQWLPLAQDPEAREAFLMPRVAMKEAVRWWVAETTGERLYSADIPLYDAGNGVWSCAVSVAGMSPVMQTQVTEQGVRVILYVQPAQTLDENVTSEEMEQQW